MNRAEVAEMLMMISAYDQRTLGEADVEAWWAVAQAQGWDPVHARRAVIDFHAARADRGRIRPAHISDLIEERRREIRKRLFTGPVDPPRELAGDPAAEVAWRREHCESLVRAELDEWASVGRREIA